MIKWIRETLKATWQGIKKGWNWLLSKIKNIFSSSKSHNSNPEETKTEEQNQQKNQQKVVVTPEQTLAHRRESHDSVKVGNSVANTVIISHFDQLPENLKSQINNLDDEVKSLILKDKSVLELIKKYPKFSAIFINKKHTDYVYDYNKYIKPLFSNQCVLELFEKDNKLRSILSNNEIYFNGDLINLLEHLANCNETMLSRIKNHPEFARAMLNGKNYRFCYKNYIELFDILFSQDQEDILEKLEYDLDFTINVLTVPCSSIRQLSYGIYPDELERLICMMSCLKDKKDIKLLKPILQCNRSKNEISSIEDTTEIPENKREHIKQTPMENHFRVSTRTKIIDNELSKRLIKKFFEYFYNNLSIYKAAINLNDKAIDLSVLIRIFKEDEEPEGVSYDKKSREYEYITHLQHSYNNDDTDAIIDKVLDAHFNRIKEILRERLPNYLRGKLSNHMPPNTVDVVNKAFPDRSVSTSEPDSLISICLAQVMESLHRS